MKSIVIVNPTSYTGHGYATVINKHFSEYIIIGLWTSSAEREKAGNSAMHLINMHFIAESREYCIETLKSYNPECFLVGNDAAFALADYLQCTFSPNYSNDPDKMIHRTSKYAYLKYLSENNIVKTNQFILNRETVDHCRTGEWVVKPCVNDNDSNVYIKPNFSLVKSLIESSTPYMVQEFVEGEEYCMEICSYRSVHRCTMASVIRGAYLIDSVHPWYEENELISSEDPNIKIIYNYVVSILDMLGVKLGLSWTKVKINNGVPTLISINFRSQDYGTLGPILNATGYTWAMESLRAYLKMYTIHPLIYDKIGNFNKIFVNNYTEKFIDKMYWARVDQLPGVAYCEKRNVYGKHCPVTTDADNILGMIVLQNNDSTLYQLSHGTINSWKKDVC
jgi:hypothetical protein